MHHEVPDEENTWDEHVYLVKKQGAHNYEVRNILLTWFEQHGLSCAIKPNFSSPELHDNKQIFMPFLFNIRNYSPEVINIQRREVEYITQGE